MKRKKERGKKKQENEEKNRFTKHLSLTHFIRPSNLLYHLQRSSSNDALPYVANVIASLHFGLHNTLFFPETTKFSQLEVEKIDLIFNKTIKTMVTVLSL